MRFFSSFLLFILPCISTTAFELKPPIDLTLNNEEQISFSCYPQFGLYQISSNVPGKFILTNKGEVLPVEWVPIHHYTLTESEIFSFFDGVMAQNPKILAQVLANSSNVQFMTSRYTFDIPNQFLVDIQERLHECE